MRLNAIRGLAGGLIAIGFMSGACAPDKGASPRVAPEAPAAQRVESPANSPSETHALEEADQSRPNPVEEEEAAAGPHSHDHDENDPEQASTPAASGVQTSADVFVEGSRGFKFEPFKLPDVIIDRKQRRGEDLPAPHSLYSMHEAQLVIDLSKDKMLLNVDIEADGEREQIQLEGSFDRQGRNWLSNLYAVDPVIKNERRIQAVVFCLRPFICDQIWMDLYYHVKGELKRRQFVVGAEKPRISLSETTSVPLPEVNEDGLLVIPRTSMINDEDSERQWDTPPPPPESDSQPIQEEDSQESSQEPIAVEDAEEEEVDESVPAMPEVDQAPSQIPPMPRRRPEVFNRQAIPIDDATIEYSTEMQLPPPEVSEHSVQGAELLQINLSGGWSAQAKGSHTNGYLENGTLMTHRGCGFKRRDVPSRPIQRSSEDTTASWGTDLMMEMLSEAACAAERVKPGHPLLVGNISIRRGGKYGSHSSHQTGLDADLGFYHRNRDISAYWRPLEENFEANFDYEKNWAFLKALHSAAEQRLMIVFVDRGIKAKLCKWVEQNEGLPTDSSSAAYKALRHLRHWDGHANHYHVRLFCPGTSGCVNSDADPNFSGTGC